MLCAVSRTLPKENKCQHEYTQQSFLQIDPPPCYYWQPKAIDLRRASLLIREFLTEHETTVVPQPTYSPDLTPADFFLFPKLKILTKRSPISDGRGDRRKFDKGPSRHPAKHIPGRVPELEKRLGAVYQEWRGVL